MSQRVVALERAAGALRLLPGEPPPPSWFWPPPDPAAISLDPARLSVLATRALAVGEAGQTAVGVACLNHGDGASTVARGLATCLAEQFGKRVVLVEANQRSPSLRRALGLADGPGLGDVVAQRVPLGAALQMTGRHRLVLALPASLRPQARLTAESLRGVLATLLAHADAVVVDFAPMAPYRDTLPLCGSLDGVVLVLRSGHSAEAEARRAIDDLNGRAARVLSAVLNRARAAW